jgi:hypothetical protein
MGHFGLLPFLCKLDYGSLRFCGQVLTIGSLQELSYILAIRLSSRRRLGRSRGNFQLPPTCENSSHRCDCLCILFLVLCIYSPLYLQRRLRKSGCENGLCVHGHKHLLGYWFVVFDPEYGGYDDRGGGLDVYTSDSCEEV